MTKQKEIKRHHSDLFFKDLQQALDEGWKIVPGTTFLSYLPKERLGNDTYMAVVSSDPSSSTAIKFAPWLIQANTPEEAVELAEKILAEADSPGK